MTSPSHGEVTRPRRPARLCRRGLTTPRIERQEAPNSARRALSRGFLPFHVLSFGTLRQHEKSAFNLMSAPILSPHERGGAGEGPNLLLRRRADHHISVMVMLSTRNDVSPLRSRICRLLSSDGGVNVAVQKLVHVVAG